MSNKYKILLIEDDDRIRTIVTTLLELEKYQVICAGTCSLAKSLFASYQPDVIILDLGLPDADGMEFLEFVRRNFLTPIIILSARFDETDKVKALDAGANDYITKPFSSQELLARIRMIIRNYNHRAPSGKLPGGKFRLDDLMIDYDARQVFIKGEEIKLTQTEYNIVTLLSEHSGRMMSYAAIIKEIWGYTDEGSVKKLQVNMANIRRKFGIKRGETKYISNELGIGYRMEIEN